MVDANTREPLRVIVSKIPQTIAWLKSLPEFEDFDVTDHLGRAIHTLQPGDVVVGNMPLFVAALVCENGAEYWNINIRKPKDRTWLSVDDLKRRASVTRFLIEDHGRVV